MRIKIIILSTLLISNIFIGQDDFPILKGLYLGQKSPGMKPEVFASGIVSLSGSNELGIHFSRDLKQLYFTRSIPDGPILIMSSEKNHGIWKQPFKVPFMKKYPGVESCLSYDGKRLVYVWVDNDDREFNHDFYVVEKKGETWGIPKPMTDQNLGKRRISPSLSKKGNLFFSGDYDNPGKKDIYFSKFINAEFLPPENLGPAVNSEYHEEHVFVDPDESYILFDSYRPNKNGKSDIYVSFKNKEGTWNEAQNLGGKINSEHWDWYPYISPDGKYLFFCRTVNGEIDIYWVDAKIIDELKPKDLK